MENAPILSTPAEHILEEPTPRTASSSVSALSEEQLYVQYEIKRTVNEIRAGRWKKIALQFPDEMLVDAPRVFERLRDGLKSLREGRVQPDQSTATEPSAIGVAARLETVSLDGALQQDDHVDERLCILADTSYGACCVDEVAAEHVDAEVVVHYGRACLSPTARLPVIYIFTSKPIDLDAAVASFKEVYPSMQEKVCLMADIPYAHNLDALKTRLDDAGYTSVFKTEIVREPSSLLPNRTIPAEAKDNAGALKDYSVFHISSPPTALLLTLASRIKAMHVFPTDTPFPTATLETSTAHMLRRRYALITRLSTAPIFGILINTLSVANYMAALQRCQALIARAGKKSYVFVVGKVNAAKVANFSEIGGWVVVGCWESSVVESADFFRPLITPFELEVALTADERRVWGAEWVADFAALLGRPALADGVGKGRGEGEEGEERGLGSADDIQRASEDGNYDDDDDDEPPEFDLRTGKYVSHSRPMGRPTRASARQGEVSKEAGVGGHTSSALVQRAKSDVATVGGQVSPAAEFLRSKRTWQGLGSDYEIAYERDEQGKIRGAAMEEGRSGVAKGYTVGEDKGKS